MIFPLATDNKGVGARLQQGIGTLNLSSCQTNSDLAAAAGIVCMVVFQLKGSVPSIERHRGIESRARIAQSCLDTEIIGHKMPLEPDKASVVKPSQLSSVGSSMRTSTCTTASESACSHSSAISASSGPRLPPLAVSSWSYGSVSVSSVNSAENPTTFAQGSSRGWSNFPSTFHAFASASSQSSPMHSTRSVGVPLSTSSDSIAPSIIADSRMTATTPSSFRN